MAYLLYRKGLGRRSCQGIAERSKTGLKAFKNDEELPKDTLVFRWGTLAPGSLPGNPRVINKGPAIEQTSVKSTMRKTFADHGLAPKCWLKLVNFKFDMDLIDELNDFGGKSFIVRPSEHSRSKEMNFCKTFEEIKEACQKYDSYYISEYIKKDREIRVLVVSGRAIAVIEKLPESKEEVSWGCISDGNYEYVDWSSWPTRAVETALKAFKLTDLDFGAVDVIMKGEDSYVLEINTGPWLSGYYMTKFAQAFDYIVTKYAEGKDGREIIPVSGSSWKHLIHPALYEGAIV